MAETYIYIGYNNYSYFFIHFVKNKEFEKNRGISYNIFNHLIDDEFIIDYCEKAVIYEFDDNNDCSLIVIEHPKSPCNNFAFTHFLIENFYNLTNKIYTDNEIYYIKYYYQDKKYVSFDKYDEENNDFHYVERARHINNLNIKHIYDITVNNQLV